MNRIREVYDSLPDEAKDEIMSRLFHAMAWRGWAHSVDGVLTKSSLLVGNVEEIARIFGDNGHEIEEYT